MSSWLFLTLVSSLSLILITTLVRNVDIQEETRFYSSLCTGILLVKQSAYCLSQSVPCVICPILQMGSRPQSPPRPKGPTNMRHTTDPTIFHGTVFGCNNFQNTTAYPILREYKCSFLINNIFLYLQQILIPKNSLVLYVASRHFMFLTTYTKTSCT